MNDRTDGWSFWSFGHSIERLVCRSTRRSIGSYVNLFLPVVGRQFHRYVCRSVGRLVDRSNWSVGRSVGPSVGRPVGLVGRPTIGWLIRPNGQTFGRSIDMSVGRSLTLPSFGSIDRLVDCSLLHRCAPVVQTPVPTWV